MSGPRKMDEVERGASAKERAQQDAAAAIADLEPDDVLDAIASPTSSAPVADHAASSEPVDVARSEGKGLAEGARSDVGSSPDDADALRTLLARKFFTLADAVTETFHEFAIGAGAWSVELAAPKRLSTEGGTHALEQIRLRPQREGYSVLVAGTVNQVEFRAELRDYDHVAILHQMRFRQPLEITSQEWDQFLRKAEVVLNGVGIQSMRTPPPRDLLEKRRSIQRVSKGAVIALVVVLFLAAAVVWRVVVAVTAGRPSSY